MMFVTHRRRGAGQRKEEVRNSPFVEKLTAADYEVVYFTDPLDEYVMSNMPDFDDHKFQDVTKDDLKIGKDKAEKKREKKVKVCTCLHFGTSPVHKPFPSILWSRPLAS